MFCAVVGGEVAGGMADGCGQRDLMVEVCRQSCDWETARVDELGGMDQARLIVPCCDDGGCA